MSDTASFGQNSSHTDSTQPKPSAGGQSVTEAVIQDFQTRRKYGIKKYGQELLTVDGRDTLIEIYQELMDAVVYTKKALMEREKAQSNACYVMANGECISPLPCVHGDGVRLDEFVRRVLEDDRYNQTDKPGDPLA